MHEERTWIALITLVRLKKKAPQVWKLTLGRRERNMKGLLVNVIIVPCLRRISFQRNRSGTQTRLCVGYHVTKPYGVHPGRQVLNL